MITGAAVARKWSKVESTARPSPSRCYQIRSWRELAKKMSFALASCCDVYVLVVGLSFTHPPCWRDLAGDCSPSSHFDFGDRLAFSFSSTKLIFGCLFFCRAEEHSSLKFARIKGGKGVRPLRNSIPKEEIFFGRI